MICEASAMTFRPAGSAFRPSALLGLCCAAALVTSCAVTVTGEARFPEGAEPVSSLPQPCDLIPADWLPPLELAAGRPQEGSPERMVPPACHFVADDSAITDGSVTVYAATDLPAQRYAPDLASYEEVDLGGLVWKVSTGAGGIGGDCGLITVVSADTFVQVGSANYTEEEKACDKAKEAAPVVAEQLPGGTPAGEVPKEEVSPLAGLDACALIKADQAGQHGLKSPGEKVPESETQPNTCEWASSRPASRGDEVVLKIITDSPLERDMGVKPDQRPEFGGRSWLVFDAPTGSYGSCYVGTAMSKKSYVVIFSSNRVHRKRACAQAKELAPVVTENLP